MNITLIYYRKLLRKMVKDVGIYDELILMKLFLEKNIKSKVKMKV